MFVVLGLALTVSGAATAGSAVAGHLREPPCEVGKRAESPLPDPPPGGPRFSRSIYVGCGHSLGQTIALVSNLLHIGAERSFCMEFKVSGPGGGVGEGSCRKDGETWAHYCSVVLETCAPSVGPERASVGTGKPQTTISGLVPPATSEVLIRAGSAAKEVRAQAVVAHVEGPLLRRFGEQEGMTFFGGLVPGCFAPRAVRFTAIGASGEVLQRGRGEEFIERPCGYHPPISEPEIPTPAKSVE